MHAHIIPNIVKISLKRVEMNFCPGSKNYIIGIRMRIFMMTKYINELCHFYKVSLIKTGLMFHKYHFFHEIQKNYQKILSDSFFVSLFYYFTKHEIWNLLNKSLSSTLDCCFLFSRQQSLFFVETEMKQMNHRLTH